VRLRVCDYKDIPVCAMGISPLVGAQCTARSAQAVPLDTSELCSYAVGGAGIGQRVAPAGVEESTTEISDRSE
jgi:hypothetical protein